jgi:hypothetical protein
MTLKSDEEARRFEKKQSNFRESAKVHLKHFYFENAYHKKSKSSHLNLKNVSRLTQNFQIEHCLRLNVEHHVSVIINEEELNISLKSSRVVKEDLLKRQTSSTLTFSHDTVINCLHDKHRIATAQKIHLFENK